MLVLLGLLIVVSAQGSGNTPPTAISAPRPIMNGKPTDYPLRALRKHEEGDVEIAITVDANGVPGDCQVISSSGHLDLDEQTCTDMRQTVRGFEPAKDANGVSVASTFRTTVRWRVPRP